MTAWKLAAIGDEIAPEPETALDVMREVGILALELRSAWGKNVLALDDEEVAALQRALTQRGMTVPVIASPIGKTSITEPAVVEQERLERALEVAQRLNAWAIRVFSFFIPEGEAPERYRDVVVERIRGWVERAAARGIVLLHENEKHIYGDTPARCREILAEIDSPWLRAVWDPANFVQCGVRPHREGFEALAPYIAHVHVKDALLEDGRVTPAGEGDGEVRETLAALKERGYTGYLSLEPHLALAGEQGGFSGPAAFRRAVQALEAVLATLSEGR